MWTVGNALARLTAKAHLLLHSANNEVIWVISSEIRNNTHSLLQAAKAAAAEIRTMSKRDVMKVKDIARQLGVMVSDDF